MKHFIVKKKDDSKRNSNNEYNNKKIYVAVIIISIICLALSIIIQIEKARYSANQSGFCSAITHSNGCETVQTSDYGRLLGVDNPIYGIIGFGILATLSSIMIIGKRNNIIKSLIIIGGLLTGLVAIWFLYVQEFVLHQYCIFCIMVDILSILLLGIAVYLIFNKHK